MTADWNVDALKEFVDRKFEEQDARFEEQKNARVELTKVMRELYDANIASVKELITSEMRSTRLWVEEAFQRVEEAVKKNESSIHDFNGRLSNVASEMMPRKEYDVNHKALEQQVVAQNKLIEKFINERSGRTSITAPVWGVVGAILAAVLAAVVISWFNNQKISNIQQRQQDNYEQRKGR